MPLSAYRVVEVGTLPAGAYCGRLLADFGAEVIKVEPPGGDPGRRGPPQIDIGEGRSESGYFAWLNYGKNSVVLDLAAEGDGERLRELIGGADVLIDSLGLVERGAAGLDHAALRRSHPALVCADVSWFGRSGPYRDLHCTDSVCRALAGLVKLTGPEEGPPLALPDYQAGIAGGLAAFIAVMAALQARLAGDDGRALEISVHEANIALAEYQAVEAWAAGASQRRCGVNRFAPTYPVGIYPCRTGWLGITIVTPAQWASFCELLGMPDLARHPDCLMGADRLPQADALEARFVPKLRERDAAEWFAHGLELRLPFAVVPDMGELLASEVFRARKAIVPVRVGARDIEAPGSPLHLTATPPRFGGTVPRAGEHDAAVADLPARPAAPAESTRRARPRGVRLPLEGIRIVDLSMGWAGPLATRNMADLGADVVKVEACQYPDWWRGVDNRPAAVEQMLYEKTARFQIMNRNKRAITLDLTTEAGAGILKELVRGADAVVENYSTGVLPKLGLDYPRLREVNPSLVMVSMSAFGARGPWSECRAYGSTLEHGSGLPSVAGVEGGPPVMSHLAFGDAVGGLNAAAALLVALLHRRRTGRGQHIDLSQVQCMLPYAAAWLVEQSANGRLGPRRGNRHPVQAPHGCFRCAGADDWVLIAVADDVMWPRLCRAIGRPDLADDPSLATAPGRQAREDEIERAVEGWTRGRSADAAMEALQRAGVAAGAVRSPFDLVSDPHLAARGFWRMTDRAFIGRHPQPAPPYREDGEPYPVRWPAPTLGEFNDAVLGGLLGLSADRLDNLARDGVIGTRAVPPSQRKARAATG